MTIFEFHNTLEVAYIIPKKQTCWKCCSESLVFYFHKSLENILCSFLPFQLLRTHFTSFILEDFYGKKFKLTSPNCYLSVMYFFLLLFDPSLRGPSLQLPLNSELKHKSSVTVKYFGKLFQQQYPSKDLQQMVHHLLIQR